MSKTPPEPDAAPFGEAAWGGSEAPGAVSGAGLEWTPAVDDRRRIGRYDLEGELGRGGMGQVLAARDRLLDRTVALKRVLPGSSRAAAARLAREARITGLLEHPGVVPVLDAGYDDAGVPYYVMRLIRGRTLAALLAAATPGDESRTLRHVLAACEAVAFAHELDIVHRDLKAENILVGEFGETQVADWGLARQLGAADDAPDVHSLAASPEQSADDDGLTRVGAIIGTPASMSPEQARGEPASKASDAYSLGLILWQVATGQRPYAGVASDAILPRVARAALPDAEAVRPTIPAELLAIIRRATAAEPAARYPDAKALADDLARYLDGKRVQAHHYSPWQLVRRVARAWRAPLTVAAVAAVVLAVGGLLAFRRTVAERDRASTAADVAKAARASADRSLAAALARHAAFATTRGRRDLAETLAAAALVRGEEPEARAVLAAYAAAPAPTLLSDVAAPTCSRVHLSEEALLCVGARDVSLWTETAQGPVERWRVASQVADAALFPAAGTVVLPLHPQQVLDLEDGKARVGGSLAFLRARVLDAEGDAPAVAWDARVALPLTPDGAAATHSPMRCAGDAEITALARRRDEIALICDDDRVLHRRIDGTALRVIPLDLQAQKGATAAAWLPQSATILVGARDGSLVEVDLDAGRSETVGKVEGGPIDALVPSRTGRWVAIVAGQGGVWIWDRAGRSVVARLPGDGVRALQWQQGDTVVRVVDHRLRSWRLPKAPCATRLWSHRGRPGLGTAARSPDARWLALAPGDGGLQVVDACSGALRLRDAFADGVLKGARWSASGALLAWSATAPSLRWYGAGTLRGSTPQGRLGIKRAVMLRDGRVIAAPFGDGLWELPTDGSNEAPTTLPAAATGAVQPFLDADAPDDGAWALFLAESGAAWLVASDAPSMRPVADLPRARRLAVAGDGRTVATLAGQQVELLRWPDLAAIQRVAMPQRKVYGIALSGDGGLLAAGDRGGGVSVWRAADGRLLARMRGHDSRVADVRFAGGDLLSASWDGSVRIWQLAALTAPAAALHDAVRARWHLDTDSALQALR